MRKRKTRKARTRRQNSRWYSTTSKLTSRTNSTQRLSLTALRPMQWTSSTKWMYRMCKMRKQRRMRVSRPLKLSFTLCSSCTTTKKRNRRISIHSSTRYFCTEGRMRVRSLLPITLSSVSRTLLSWMSATSPNSCLSISSTARLLTTTLCSSSWCRTTIKSTKTTTCLKR